MLNPKLKPSWPFLIPLFLFLFFLSLLSTTKRRSPWYEQWAWNVLSPTISILSWGTHQIKGTWHRYIYLVHVAGERERFFQELQALRQKVVTFDEILAENRRFQSLFRLKWPVWPEAVAARVVAFDPRSAFKSIRIDKGAKEGIQSGQPVVAPEGLVGKVGPVFQGEALVLLLIDPACTVDVFVERSRVRGLLTGMAKNTELRTGYFLTRLEYLKRTSDIQVGDVLVTSGLDQLYPKGIAVGEVASIENDRFGIFLDAEVVPMVDFSRLEEVLVLKRK